MFSLHLRCGPDEVEELSFRLWEAGTAGIREEDRGEAVELIAGFEKLPDGFADHQASWELEPDTDWIAVTKASWPARAVGERIFLAPVWNAEATPLGRCRVIHNPGSASGTGEHPCTQLALEALERAVHTNDTILDIGTGSGILAVAASALEARRVFAFDLDAASLVTARENFALNRHPARLINGSTDCLASEAADIVVANISGSVLLSLADDLLRILRSGGRLILTGFPESELSVIMQAFGAGEVTAINEWRCLTLTF